MRIKYFVNNSNYIFKSKNRRCVLHVYLARQKKNIHIAFDRSLMSLENTEAIHAIKVEIWRSIFAGDSISTSSSQNLMEI